MARTGTFEFNADSVAGAYDDVLVPLLFRPWALRLIEENPPWQGCTVLDLATGTGVVADLLASRVGPEGKVVGVDLNRAMLAIAKSRCAGASRSVTFVESSAHPLEIESESVDVVVCQQGFQFFPDRRAAAGEMYRVLRTGGRVVLTTWRPVSECDIFGSVCDALSAIGETEIADAMRLPFDFMPESELASHFSSAGFVETGVTRREHPLAVDGGVPAAVDAAFATPIGPKLYELPEAKQTSFRRTLRKGLEALCDDGVTIGRMAANVLVAVKP